MSFAEKIHDVDRGASTADMNAMFDSKQENCCNCFERLKWRIQNYNKKQSQKYEQTSIYQFFNVICQSDYFTYLILLAILLNTLTLCFDRYPISPEEHAVLETINSTATWIFVVELVIKVVGLGIQTYVADSMN